MIENQENNVRSDQELLDWYEAHGSRRMSDEEIERLYEIREQWAPQQDPYFEERNAEAKMINRQYVWKAI